MPKKRINRKAKGIQAERDLIHKFQALGWSAVRIAGSGSSKYPSPDILAGNGFRRIAIEAKSIASTRKYFSLADVEQLDIFAKTFGCEAWLAVKFSSKPWVFLTPEDLEETASAFVVHEELIKIKGFSIYELIDEKNNNLDLNLDNNPKIPESNFPETEELLDVEQELNPFDAKYQEIDDFNDFGK